MAHNFRWSALRGANRQIHRAKSPQLRTSLRFESLEMRSLLSVQPVEVAANSPAIPVNGDVIEWATNPETQAVNLLLSERNWTDSEQIANELGAHLVTINDDAENSWVWNTFNPQLNRHLWIGLTDSAHEGVFTWSSGEPVTYTNWEPSQPSGDFPNIEEDWVEIGYQSCGGFDCPTWNDRSDGIGSSTFPTMHGVVETAVIVSRQLVPSNVLVNPPVPQLIVEFSGALSVEGSAAGTNSVTNPANWQLMRNGSDISSRIVSIVSAVNRDSNRHAAVLSLNLPLTMGTYVLTARETIHDTIGGALDGDLDGLPGGDFVRQFFIGSMPPQADAGEPYSIAEGEGLQLDASSSLDLDAVNSVYWTNVSGASLQSANDDGGGFATLVTGVAQPRGMAVDPVNRFAYWTELGDPAIHRVSLDGTGTDEFVVDVRNAAAGIAFDIGAGKLYWSDSDGAEINAGIRGGKIRRANLDGSQPEDVVASNLEHPVGIAVDAIGGKIYWSDVATNLIQQADLDGSNVETLLTDIDEATGLALDQRARKLYWADSATGRVQRANLDGSGLETVLEVPATTVALNIETGTLYWTEGSGNVKRARLDGTDPFTIAAGVGEPWGIGVLPPLYFSWDLNGDGDFGDALGETPFLSWDQLAALGINDDGEYAVRLRVTDAFGLSSVAETTLTVANAAPFNLELDPLEAYLEGSEVLLSGRFADPGTLDVHTVDVDWGDGSTGRLELALGDRAFAVPHRYVDDNGGASFLATVTLADDDGGATSASREIWISNTAPEILHLDVTPSVVDEGDEVTLTGMIGDVGILDTHTVSINWGDGKTSEAQVNQDQRTFVATHIFVDDDPTGTPSDTYFLSIYVMDDDGDITVANSTVAVENVAPTVTITAIPIVVNVGQPFTLQALSDDPGDLDSIEFGWQVTLDDQIVATGTGESFTFTPLTGAAYVFTLAATDDDGGMGTAQIVLEAGPCRVPGDTNEDCRVDLVDLNNVRNHFGETGLGVVDLSFNAPSPGTLLDKDGVGVSFTHRLPGTGDGLPDTDPNMDLEPGINGRLLLKSTNANANGGLNLGELEAPGVLQEGIGQDDLNLTATFLNVQVPNSGDNLTLYAGTAWNNSVRVGFHESNVYHIAINRSGVDEILFSSAVNAFAPGDDVTLTLSRRMGNWFVSWQNHTNSSASGESTAFELAFLNVESDLYLGVQHASPTTTIQQTATIDSFTLDILRPIPGDSNGDFIVALSDLNAVRNNFGASFPAPQASWSADAVTAGSLSSFQRPASSNLVDAVFAQFASKGALNDSPSMWPALRRRRA